MAIIADGVRVFGHSVVALTEHQGRIGLVVVYGHCMALKLASLSDAEVSDCLDGYTDPHRAFAWPLYDEDPAPNVLSGADLTAPALLSYPIRGTILNQMGCEGDGSGEAVQANPYRVLYRRLDEFVGLDDAPAFWDLSTAEIASLAGRKAGEAVLGPQSWQAFIRCLDAVGDCDRLTSVAVTKILHRKRPTLVPLNDSRVRSFFGVGHSYSALFSAIHAEVSDEGTLGRLERLAKPYVTPQGRPMTSLRALDIIAWSYGG